MSMQTTTPRAQRQFAFPDDTAEWFGTRDIARALATNKNFVLRLAERQAWPRRATGNKLEFQPSEKVRAILIAAPRAATALALPVVRFADLVGGDAQREKVLQRERAVKLVEANVLLGKERTLILVCNQVATEQPLLRISVSSLRRWCAAYAAHGIDGLVEQKRGRCGRKACAADLDEEQLLRLAAGAVEHGAWKRINETGRLNVARAYRHLVADPTLTGSARAWCHGDHASKSYVPPSIVKKVRALASPGAATLIQRGPKAAKLDGAFSECSYDNVKSGDAFTADDMTANVYVWTEWPNEEGFLLIRPQILATMDIGSMRWLNVRAVIRPKGQYNKDDVWGLIGDTLDSYGRFSIAVLEGGTWQSGVVVGEKTGLSDADRFGGLQSLGIRVIHTRTPRGKIIETAFNQLQYAADNCKGFCGRLEMKDAPEQTRKNIALVEGGFCHPREMFLSLAEYTDHLAAVMKSLNHERGDGKILRGLCPEDKWAQDNPQMEAFPDSSKYLYRAAYNLVQVTRNGVRVTQGSGRNQLHYCYSHPALEPHRGRRVVIYWNDYDPDTDAVIYTVQQGRPHQLIAVAPRVQEIPRFNATPEQTEAELRRKKQLAQVAVTQRRALAPYLNRTQAAPQQDDDMAARLKAARAEAAGKAKSRAVVRNLSADAAELMPDAPPSRVLVATEMAEGLPVESAPRGGGAVKISETDLSADALL